MCRHVFLEFHIYEHAAFHYLLHFVALQSPDDRPDFETVIGRLRRMLAVETLARQPSGELEKLHLHNRFPWTAALQRLCMCGRRQWRCFVCNLRCVTRSSHTKSMFWSVL